MCAMYMGWETGSKSLREIGEFFGGLELCSGNPADSPNLAHLQFNCCAADHHNVKRSHLTLSLLWKQRKTRSLSLFRFRIFAYSVHGRLSQPFPSFLSQLSGAMQRELLLHAHLMCLNRLNAYMQFSC